MKVKPATQKTEKHVDISELKKSLEFLKKAHETLQANGESENKIKIPERACLKEYLELAPEQTYAEFYFHLIKQIEEQVVEIEKKLNQQPKYKGLPTNRSILESVTKKQKGTVSELNSNVEKIKLLRNLIESDNSLSEDERSKALKAIRNNTDTDNRGTEINKWLGKKLTKPERRLLRTLRHIIQEMIDKEEITTNGKSLYEAEIQLSRIYDEYGLEKRAPKDGGGYDYNQTKEIQEVLFGLSTRGLHEDLLFKHEQIERTRYILQIQGIKQKVIIKGKEVEQLTKIVIAVPHFLFVSDINAKSYYYQDIKGFKRLMAIKGMSKSNVAFNIAEYLESILPSEAKERTVNIAKVISEAGEELNKLCKTRKKKGVDIIQKIFDNMVKAGYLIKSWQYNPSGGQYQQGQFTFENIRYQAELNKGERNAEVINLAIKKSTKGRNTGNKKQPLTP